MTDSMTHRGPNDRGTYLADGIALGVRPWSLVEAVRLPRRAPERRDGVG